MSKFIPILILSLTLFPINDSSAEDELKSSMSVEDEKIVISRSSSKFIFREMGEIETEFRVFGFNQNPMGENNKDEYVKYFGLPLIINNLFIVAGKNEASKEYLETVCENITAENPAYLAVISINKKVNERISKLEKKSRMKRTCVRIKGKDLKFEKWLVNDTQQNAEKIAKMTKDFIFTEDGRGADLTMPLLLEEISEVECDD